MELAKNISERDEHHDYYVNRRNGYYAVDYYTKYPESEYRGYLEVGTANQVYYFLRGMLEAYWLMYRL